MHILIIPHWDTDGVISAALLAGNLNGKVDYYIPDIGSYTIKENSIKKINSKKYDCIFIVDFALQKKIVQKLKAKKIIIIDHHLIKKVKGVEYYNLILKGKDCPCSVMSLIEYLDKDYLLESCIAAIGDKEQNILRNEKFKKRIERCQRKFKIDFNKMYKIKNLIDSSYMLARKNEILRTINLISNKGILYKAERPLLKWMRPAPYEFRSLWSSAGSRMMPGRIDPGMI